MPRGRRTTLSDTKKKMASHDEDEAEAKHEEASDKDNLDEPKQASKRRGRRRITIDLGD